MINDMTIFNRLKVLIAEKEMRDGKRLTYRAIAKNTGISTSTLVRYASQSVDKIDLTTLESMCKYFEIQPGDFLIWDKNDPYEAATITQITNPDYDGLEREGLLSKELKERKELVENYSHEQDNE